MEEEEENKEYFHILLVPTDTFALLTTAGRLLLRSIYAGFTSVLT